MTKSTAPFTIEELTDIANEAFGDTHTIERDGKRYTFTIEHDDESTMDYVNGMDALGRLAWPVRNRDTGYDERPADFTGAAIKFGPTNMCDTVWWEPYREGKKVYASPEDRAFMRDLLDYGTVFVGVEVAERGPCGYWHGVAYNALGGIESPLCGAGNWTYLAECFSDLLAEASAIAA